MIARLIAALLIAGVVVPSAFAAEWTRYVNPRFGAGVDIPPGFEAQGAADVANGDGKYYRAANGRGHITIWGALATQSEFSSEMRARIEADEAEGWAITYRSDTPDWAAWGGTRAGHVFFAKSISTCNGQQTANVRLTYPALDIPRFDSIVNRLGQTLAQDGGCF